MPCALGWRRVDDEVDLVALVVALWASASGSGAVALNRAM